MMNDASGQQLSDAETGDVNGGYDGSSGGRYVILTCNACHQQRRLLNFVANIEKNEPCPSCGSTWGYSQRDDDLVQEDR